jgi:predicted acetyltransferase
VRASFTFERGTRPARGAAPRKLRSRASARLVAGQSPPEAGLDELTRINEDPERFIADQVDREAKGPSVMLPGGSIVPRLPGYRLWMWDGEFCGVIGFRWQPGTADLPLHVLGHVGFSFVPWKRRRGYATRALQLLLPHIRKEGLSHVELTTDPGNVGLQRVIAANGGRPLVLGVATAITTARLGHRGIPGVEFPDAQGFLRLNLVSILCFSPLTAAALYLRRSPQAHKRLMLMATTVH